MASHNTSRRFFFGPASIDTIQPQQFNIWLVQSYHFVIVFTHLTASLIQSAPLTILIFSLGVLIFLVVPNV